VENRGPGLHNAPVSFRTKTDEPGASTPAAEVPPAPGVVAAQGVLRELSQADLLLLVPQAESGQLAERMLAFLEKTSSVQLGSALGDWLLEQPDVDELFADDEQIEGALRRHFSG
jgi:hypothetical protein